MGIFTKLKDFVGLSEAQEYEYEYDEVSSNEYQGLYQEENGAIAPESEETQVRRTRERRTELRSTPENMSNVIGMPGAAKGLSQVVVMEPRSFEEMPQAIQALRERKSLVLNLTMMDPEQAQRAVDFVAGGTYALDGHQERIGDSIFLFAPSCAQVTSQSSVLNDAPISQPRVVRPTASPSPAWASEIPVSRFAQ